MKWIGNNSLSWAVSSLRLMSGKIQIASVSYDPLTSKGSLTPYRLEMLVPGLKKPISHWDTEKSAKARAEELFSSWVSTCGLQEKPEKPAVASESNIDAEGFRKWRQGRYKITQISPMVHAYEWRNDVTGQSGSGRARGKHGFDAFHQCSINLDPDAKGSLVKVDV